ncbi:phosphoribosylpyrophosphate synthetase [Robertkochia marina]|uniref:Phosphoribosylpyrophosphate synthetase n=1 Tax=Robertkochia marina TaxID=1227945 RepID=A0A4S3LZL9_9FLAO|nr:phosphoribosylpyrophosphate synthetase [Robertkochia marina]THD65823.1 phosphoribosylpyrophosphate synthetase [Robertkochia marina]TRZ41326.1 phosphoribosylpyrophosphate synthetase [Robertkochia marina]
MENSYESLSVAITALKEEGYTHDYNLKEEVLENKEAGTVHEPHELRVVKYYRFEGRTNPDDSSVLYVIETDNGEKGLLVDAYGAYSGQISQEMLDKLKMH